MKLLLVMALAASSVFAADEGGPRQMSPEAKQAPHDTGLFGPDPSYADKPYNPDEQLRVYGGKSAVPTPRPLLELGRPIYQGGPFEPSGAGWGEKNPTDQAFSIYGDWRTAFARNQNGGNSTNVFATRLNLDVDWKLTATERLHAFFRPLDHGADVTRCASPNGAGYRCERAMDLKPETLFFEGDLGSISAGMSGQYRSWDLPFAVGKIPLLFQNGIWLEDAFTGLAFTLPAKNSRLLDISNYDVTFFAGIDDVDTGGVRDAGGRLNNREGHIYGATTFIEAMQGYWELGYAYTRARNNLGIGDQSYHNIGISFTRRYGGWLSNSIRLIHNTGQSMDPGVRQTADGTLLLVENSLVTRRPLTLVPYLNVFVGKDRPQSVARDPGAGGVLKNTGINFETDGLTGFPKLDDTANSTWGGALGVQYLFDLQRQIVVEWGTVQTVGNDPTTRITQGPQHALGARYQQNLSKAWLIRSDIILANRVNARDIGGIRFEIRRKF